MNSFYLRGIHISPRSIAVTRTLSLYCPQHRFLSLHPSLIARKSPLQQSLLIKRIPAFRQLLPLASMLPFHLSKQYSTSPSTSPSTTPTPPTPPSKPTTPQENHENIYTIPNILTFTRLAATPVIAYLILHHQPYLATGLLLYAGLTDLVDGWIARKWNLKSVVGTIIDPMADKFLMISLTGSLAWTGQLPLWLAVIILGRDLGLGIAALYYRWISLPPPKTMGRYWDFSLPSAEVHPTTISKFNTLFQLLLIGTTTIQPILAFDIVTYLSVMQYTVATTTIWSGLSYVYSKDAVKILKSGDQKN